MLEEMQELSFSEPFRTPVSAIDFPDYHRTIATPMDLSTVRESLQIGDYGSPLDFQKDMDLIFINSRKYNTNPGSRVLRMTNRLEEWFDVHILPLIRDWRRTNRRLAKHKAGYKGKGKGKGKGQSNRGSTTTTPVKRKRKKQKYDRRFVDDDEDEDLR